MTVSEPRFLLMFPPGVTPTLRGGEGRRQSGAQAQLPPGMEAPVCFPKHFSGEKKQGHLTRF